jgi:O-antigen ligase
VQWLAQHHAAERIELWTGYMDLWPLRWLAGFGFHAVKLLGSAAKRAALLPVNSTLDAPHPHDLPIQILFEFGAVGAALVIALAALAAFACLRGRNPSRPFAVATITTIWAISLVDYDLWYPWWASIVALSVMLAVRLLQDDPAAVRNGVEAVPAAARRASVTRSTVMSFRQFRWPSGQVRSKHGRQSSSTSRI